MRSRLERLIGDLGQILMYEAGVLDGHLDSLRERWAVARRARGLGELLRDQYDLLADTRQRIRRDHQARVRLWKKLAAEWRRPTPQDAGA
jgi:hypothetical protein